jgi:Spy/CpxP family protein refolding chaperone
MRSWTRSLIVTTALGAALAAGAAFSQQPAPGGPPPGGGMGMHHPDGMGGMHEGMMMGGRGMDRMLDQLNATPEQRDKIKAIFEKHRPAMQKLGEEMRVSRDQFQAVEPGDANYSKAVKQASQKAAELASRGVEEHAAMRSEVYQVLTPEQRAQLPKLREEMKAKMKERAGNRGKQHQGMPPAPPAKQ